MEWLVDVFLFLVLCKKNLALANGLVSSFESISSEKAATLLYTIAATCSLWMPSPYVTIQNYGTFCTDLIAVSNVQYFKCYVQWAL